MGCPFVPLVPIDQSLGFSVDWEVRTEYLTQVLNMSRLHKPSSRRKAQQFRQRSHLMTELFHFSGKADQPEVH